MKLIYVIFLSLFSLCLKAQTIQGTVVDENKEPVSFCNIVILSSVDSAFVSGTMTNELGEFSIENGNKQMIILQVSYLGYKNINRLCTSGNIGVLILEPDALMLDETVVTATRAIHKMKNGNLVTDVANSPLSKEHNTLDVLKKIPGMMMSQGNLTVFGSGAPIVYINNKKVNNLEEISALDPKNIKEVELITNPGAKYDAEGKAVLKIKTLTYEDGWAGKVRLEASQGRRFSNEESVGLTYKKEKLTLNGLYSFADFKSRSRQYFLNELQETKDQNWQYDEQLMTDNGVKQHAYQVGADFSITDNHAIGIQYNGSNDNMNSSANDEQKVYDNGQLFKSITSLNKYDITNDVNRVNLFYIGKLNRALELEVNVDYLKKKDRQGQVVNELEQTTNIIEIHTQTDSKLYAGKVDLSYNFEKGGVLTAGSAFNKVDIGGFLDNPEQVIANTKFSNQEKLLAGYMMYDVTLGKVSLNAGLRYENVQSEMNDLLDRSNDLSRNYSNWFPNLSLSTSFGEVKSTLSYAVRTSRPAFSILNSKTYYVNQFMQQIGNPQLQPQFSHNVQTVFQYKILNVRLGYSYIKDYIGSTMQSDGNVLITSWKNYTKAEMLRGNVSLTKSFGCLNTTLALGVSAPFFDMEYLGGTYQNNTPQIYAQTNNYFTLPKQWGITLDYMYTNGGSVGIYKFKPYHSFDLGVQKTFFTDKMDVSIKANDVFRTMVQKYDSRIGNIRFYQREDQDTRIFSVSLIYRLNNIKSKYRGTGAANEEMRRL